MFLAFEKVEMVLKICNMEPKKKAIDGAIKDYYQISGNYHNKLHKDYYK
jgi:hypothetical protein